MLTNKPTPTTAQPTTQVAEPANRHFDRRGEAEGSKQYDESGAAASHGVRREAGALQPQRGLLPDPARTPGHQRHAIRHGDHHRAWLSRPDWLGLPGSRDRIGMCHPWSPRRDGPTVIGSSRRLEDAVIVYVVVVLVALELTWWLFHSRVVRAMLRGRGTDPSQFGCWQDHLDDIGLGLVVAQ